MESPMATPALDRESPRSASSSRTRPPLPPKEPRRGSQLQIVASNADFINGTGKRGRRKHQISILTHLASLKRCLLDPTKRGKSPGSSNITEAPFPPPQPQMNALLKPTLTS